MLNIVKKLNKLISRSKKIEVETPSLFSNEKYEEIQAFVYRDLDLIKKKAAYAAYIQNLPQPLSEEAIKKINQRKIELSRELDKMIRAHKPELGVFTKPENLQINIPEYVLEIDQSPIPRHNFIPKSL
jgi:hypothetical protein